MPGGPPARALYTVSALTSLLRLHIESAFPDVWVEGEVSNLRIPTSGHAYFTLKDATSQIRAVLFRSAGRALRFALEDGMHLVCRGRVTIYEPKGDYQVIVEYAEPKGVGALQLAFEQLKARLAVEGLFETARKRPLPFFPRRIGVVTSPTGAAIRDIVQVAHKRFPGIEIVLNPVAVQGESAAGEIARAIEELNELGGLDVLIVGRGGGSLEDLWPFNEEIVARAIVASRIPVISAVGHEVDYTIADFVADLRAPTPSAAAEMVVRDRQDLLNQAESFWKRSFQAVHARLRDCRACVEAERRGLLDPTALVVRAMQRRDDLEMRLCLALNARVREVRAAVEALRQDVMLQSPVQRIQNGLTMLPHLRARLQQRMDVALELWRRSFAEVSGAMHALSPLAILGRGYSITRRWPDLTVLRTASDVASGDAVHVRLASGELLCEVRRTGEKLLPD
ncbi:MAG TPA: exodeoxyribonuclease VII large subunit [Nitrospirales bacterium]|jgi:exodeoxyribonuclease VII large subunit|nr:exodeoxyribonuclease VII large subunit [Nitrospirales bacterium]